jgi:hypothetical protein
MPCIFSLTAPLPTLLMVRCRPGIVQNSALAARLRDDGDW